MAKDSYFGSLLHELREKRDITLEVLGYGLCDAGKLSRIEAGKVEADKLLRDRLLGRLGVASENYEKFLYYSEYKGWKERQNIVHSILYGRLEEAKQQLEEYKCNYSMERPLEYQFYLSMKVQIRRMEGDEKAELCRLFQQAITLTMPESISIDLKSGVLSIEEMNLLLEYVFYSGRETSLEWYEKMLTYVELLPLDALALSKIYPKTVFYLYKTWETTKSTNKIGIGKLLRWCNRAIELLQKAKRMFYLWELLEAKEQLLQALIIENEEKGENAVKQLKEWQQTCKTWLESLTELYEDYGISKKMQNFCYIYVDMEAYCIGDVIRIRRKMFGKTMKELSEGICSERTVSRLERNEREPQREIVRRLFERLHMATEFCRNDLITENPEAKRLFGELKQSNNKKECDKVDELLKQVTAMVSLEIPENRQAIRRNELINERNKKILHKDNMDIRWEVEQIKEVLSYTIPYEVAVAPGEKYLTQNELSCLQNIIANIDWSYPEMEQCVEALYDLFERQRRIEECLNMYEFLMGTVASKLGNKGNYDLSDEIEIKILRNSLSQHRLGTIYRNIYALLWNDAQRGEKQHPVKRGVDKKNELRKCIFLCEMSDDIYRVHFFEKKLKDSM